MGICQAGIYKDNMIVTRHPLMCFGGFGQPPCKYLADCMKENQMRAKRWKPK